MPPLCSSIVGLDFSIDDTQMPNRSTDYWLLLLLAVLWSASFLLIKIGVDSIGPLTLTAGRMTIAAAVLGFGLVITKTELPLHRRALLIYLVVGFMGNTFPFILISWGETHIDSSLAAVMMGIMPIATFVLAHYFIPEEPMTARKVFGIGLGFGGLVILVGVSALGGLGDNVLGQLAVLGGAISYGITTVFVRVQPEYPKLSTATGATLAGMLTSIPLAFWWEAPLSITPTAASMTAMLILGVFSTALASLIYFRVIHSLGATIFSQLNYVVPILGSIWGVILLGEWLPLRVLVALALVLIGIYFVQQSPALGFRGRGKSG